MDSAAKASSASDAVTLDCFAALSMNHLHGVSR